MMIELFKRLNEKEVLVMRAFAQQENSQAGVNGMLEILITHSSSFHPVYRAEVARMLAEKLSLREQNYMDLSV